VISLKGSPGQTFSCFILSTPGSYFGACLPFPCFERGSSDPGIPACGGRTPPSYSDPPPPILFPFRFLPFISPFIRGSLCGPSFSCNSLATFNAPGGIVFYNCPKIPPSFPFFVLPSCLFRWWCTILIFAYIFLFSSWSFSSTYLHGSRHGLFSPHSAEFFFSLGSTLLLLGVDGLFRCFFCPGMTPWSFVANFPFPDTLCLLLWGFLSFSFLLRPAPLSGSLYDHR